MNIGADLSTQSAKAGRATANSRVYHAGTKVLRFAAAVIIFNLQQICPFPYASASDLPIKALVEPRTGSREVGMAPGKTARRKGWSQNREGARSRGSPAVRDESPTRGQRKEPVSGRGLTVGACVGVAAGPAVIGRSALQALTGADRTLDSTSDLS